MDIKKLLTALLFVGTLNVASADESIEWETAAMACTPTSGTVVENKYITTAGVIKYHEGKSGRLNFICPISYPLPSGQYYIRGTIKTPSVNKWGISIALRRRDKRSDTVETVLNANTVGRGEGLRIRNYDSGNARQLDPDSRYVYWVQISYQRNSDRTDRSSVIAVELRRR